MYRSIQWNKKLCSRPPARLPRPTYICARTTHINNNTQGALRLFMGPTQSVSGIGRQSRYQLHPPATTVRAPFLLSASARFLKSLLPLHNKSPDQPFRIPKTSQKHTQSPARPPAAGAPHPRAPPGPCLLQRRLPRGHAPRAADSGARGAC